MTVYEMAQRYYPRLWDKHRLDALVKAKKLTRAQADEIMNGETA